MMGRAIDMEKDIDVLKNRVKKLEDITRGMTHKMDGLNEKAPTTEHIDLVDDVKAEEADNGKKANDKGSSKSRRNVKSSDGDGKVKDSKSGSGCK